jgi:2,4-dienoyl-CoA reductase-like NADH-dependent reductase (Old Yellow Enzyme family)
MPDLTDPVTVGRIDLDNRLYRAPLLECAGNGPDAVETLRESLVPGAAAGAGLLFQGATIVRGEGGCAAPGMTRVHDPAFVSRLRGLTDAVHARGGKIALQLEHGGLRAMETWHAAYRESHPDLEQLAVSRPPRPLRVLDAAGFLDYDARVLSTGEVYDLAADFGRAAGYAVEAGYDAVHVAGANMGIVQQFLSPFYNRRDDEFGDGVRFLEVLHEAVRERAGDVPLFAKVPAETAAPPGIRRRLSAADCVNICRRCAEIGYDGVIPVSASVFWDMSIVRGAYPERAWRDESFGAGYAAAFGGPLRARLIAALNRLESLVYDRERCWNADLCRRVREAVDVPVGMEGGVRSRADCNRHLGEACDLVGMGRPFYAEPRLPALLLSGGSGGDSGAGGCEAESGTGTGSGEGARVACRSCNNCAVPQVTGAPGVCRTPEVLAERGERERAGAYENENP